MKLTKRNLHNIKCIFEEKTGADLNPAHREQPGKRGKWIALAAAAAICILMMAACAYSLFTPLNGDELSLWGTYEGNGIVSIYVENGSDRVLTFQEQLKLISWTTGEEAARLDGEVIFQNTTFAAHSSGTMTVDLSAAYDIAALETADPGGSDGAYYYLLLTNNSFLFGHDWMCSFHFTKDVPEETSEDIQPDAYEEAPEEIRSPEDADLSLLTAQTIGDIAEELRFYFEDAYGDTVFQYNAQNPVYLETVQQLLAEFDGAVVFPVDPLLLVDKTPEDVVFDDTFPAALQYILVGENYHCLDGYGRIVGASEADYALTLEALLPQYRGQADGGVSLPLIYLFTYEVSAIRDDSYAFLYGRFLSFGEMKPYRVYQDEQYAVYEMTDLFYTDLDAYLDYFLTTRTDLYVDDQIRLRVHSIYDYYRDRETLGSQFYFVSQ